MIDNYMEMGVMPTHEELLVPLGKIGEAFSPGSDKSKNISIWEEALTEDVVWEAPFAEPPIYIKGRRAVGMFFDWLLENVPNFEMALENVYFTEGEASYVIQVSGGGPVLGGGVYNQQYFSLIRIHDGKISYFREHFKVAETYRAFGRDRFHDSIAEMQRVADGDA
ncbi:nuclear transport factor 2 family protein [Aquisediminimonas sediminicola]|uniref:nuclear transport factor 2 family protein n=1 Tax=Alteraquisediminimonas sediminicola TaxID=2676787 RepID=UPI001C8E0B29|nr:nuclear transport factor 2 family protein [Aquisediminimonas sediminicola]